MSANLAEITIPTPDNTASERSQSALANAQSMTVVTAEQYEAGARELQAIKGKHREIDEARKQLVKPIDEARKRIQDFFSAPLKFLEQAEAIVKGKLVAYQNEQDRLRREEQRKAEEAARKEREKLEQRAAKAAESGKHERAAELAQQATTVVAPVIQREAPKVTGINTRETWKFQVTDPALVPREYLSVDETKIRKVVGALKGDTNIPGVRVYPEKQIASAS